MPLPRDKQDLLETELESGERLLWSGEPNPIRVARQGVGVCFFGLVWTAFTVNFVHLWWHGVKPTTSFWGMSGLAIDLFFALFLLIGFALLLSPVWSYRQSARTAYAITSQRVIIITGGKTRQIASYGKTELGPVSRVERSDRTGDLTVAEKSYKDSDGDRRTKAIQLIGIPEVRQVEAILRDALILKEPPERE